MDYINDKMYPSGCYKPNYQYNILVIDKLGQVVKKEAVSTKLSYGMVHFSKLKPGAYSIKVMNFGDAAIKGDFVLSAYAGSKEVKIDYSNSYLMKDLEHAKTKDLVNQTYHHDKVTSKSFFDPKTGDLTISF